jgi:hypothetical protein
MAQKRRNLTDVLAALEEVASQCCAEVARTFDPDQPSVAVGRDPTPQVLVLGRIVGELPNPQGTSEIVEHRDRERALVRIDPHRDTHPGLLSPADLRCDQREDTQALGLEHPSIKSLPLVRSRPEGRVRSEVTGIEPRRAVSESPPAGYAETLLEEESPPPDCHACGKVERFHQTEKKFLRKQPPARTIAELQAQVDRFVDYYNHVRPHRAKNRKTPKSGFDSRDKARPIKREGTFTRELRVRHDRVDAHGVVTIRYKSKLHHIGMGRALKGTRIILLVAGRHIRIITTDGELLRDFELDPSQDYQPQSMG